MVRKTERNLIRILRVTNSKGFSLIEIMIVVALLALITGIGVPALNTAFRASKDSFVKKLSLLLRDARDRAMLSDKLMRLRIDMEKQEYWLEEAPSSYLRQKAPDVRQSEREKEEKAQAEAGAFRLVSELTPAKVPLPPGLKVMEVISPKNKDSLKDGIVDVYFYNNGSADGVSIHFEDDEKTRLNLTLHPLTGHSKVSRGYEEGKP